MDLGKREKVADKQTQQRKRVSHSNRITSKKWSVCVDFHSSLFALQEFRKSAGFSKLRKSRFSAVVAAAANND